MKPSLVDKTKKAIEEFYAKQSSSTDSSPVEEIYSKESHSEPQENHLHPHDPQQHTVEIFASNELLSQQAYYPPPEQTRANFYFKETLPQACSHNETTQIQNGELTVQCISLGKTHKKNGLF